MSSFPGTFKCLPGTWYIIINHVVTLISFQLISISGIRCDEFTDYITDNTDDNSVFVPQHFFLSHCHADHMVDFLSIIE